MIDFLSFGEGFRKDGANWGLRAEPYLRGEGRWRRLESGLHVLDNPSTHNLIVNRLAVMSDGRGQLMMSGDPSSRRMLETAGLAIHAGPLAMFGMGTYVDREQPVVPIFNYLDSDIRALAEETAHVPLPMVPMDQIGSLARLTGVIRYIP